MDTSNLYTHINVSRDTNNAVKVIIKHVLSTLYILHSQVHNNT